MDARFVKIALRAGRTLSLARHALVAICLGSSASALANDDADAPKLVAESMAKACAVRGLTLSRPVEVRPMTMFQGGYTPGVGSVTWEQDYAEQWRSGWCALGVYCVHETDEATASSAEVDAGDQANADKNKTPLDLPAGLYDAEKNVLFVRDTASPTATATIAHETVHALQYQNYPRLHALHLWYNRDLAAAANSAIEGDAHVVGWYFDPQRRLYLCSMDARHAAANHARWWRWTPHRLWAHEGFPHVFGPELALGRYLAAGQGGVDDLLRDPPLSTLHVLKPAHADGVDFIDLPDDLVNTTLADRGCEAGLVNTAGALGIWGLLRQHDAANTPADEPPALIEHWRGDRFSHIACPGDRNDELAWLTRWRHAAAAQDFAARYERIAVAVATLGEVLSAAPSATVRDNVVVVTTPALRTAVAALAGAPIKTFARFDDWLKSGCFPQQKCTGPATETPLEATADFACAGSAARPAAFEQWLETVRGARSTTDVADADIAALMEAAGELATFCAVNTTNNSDLAQACRAAYTGIPVQTQLLKDTNWRGLPHCATEHDVRRWMRRMVFADAERPLSAPAAFANLYGTALAARAFAERNMAGLDALADEPPLSTRQILWPTLDTPVDFLDLPRERLSALGCEITTSDVRGALSIWNLLIDHDNALDVDEPPPTLRQWRGDRQLHLRCASEAEGWIWASRWASATAAQRFAARYNALPPASAQETGLAAFAEANGRTVWAIPPALAAVVALLKDDVEVRSYRTFGDWRRDGCYPNDVCN